MSSVGFRDMQGGKHLYSICESVECGGDGVQSCASLLVLLVVGSMGEGVVVGRGGGGGVILLPGMRGCKDLDAVTESGDLGI